MEVLTITEDGKYEWDENKNQLNIKNHGISFSEILDIFEDPFLLTSFDKKHSTLEEEREFSLGCLNGIVVVAVSHTDRNGRIRIISARQAEPKLRKAYYDYVTEINK